MSKQDPWIPNNCPAASAAVRTLPGIFGGFSLRETGGTAAVTVRLFDNASAASGTLLGVVSLPAGGSQTFEFKWGARALNGIFAQVSGTGTVEGSVFTN